MAVGAMAEGAPAGTVPGTPLLEVQDRPPALDRLPLLRTWSEDGGPFVTLPLVYTEHPRGLGSNLGMYRIQRHGDDRVGLHVQIGKGGGFHLAEHERLGTPMPVAVHIGGPPALILSAIAPLPENVPEVLLCSLLLGQRLRSAKSAHTPLQLQADAEFCLLGDVHPGERHPEGPFGDHYGYYSLRHDYPRRCCIARTRSSARPSSASRARRTSSSATTCRSCCCRCARSRCRT